MYIVTPFPRSVSSQDEGTLAGGAEARHLVVLASYAPSLVNFRGPLLEELVRRGWRVTAVAPGVDANVNTALANIGVVVVQINLARTGLNPFSDLRYLAAIRQLLRRLQPSVMLSYTAKPVIWGSIAGFLAGVPLRVAMITGLGYAFTPPDAPSLKHKIINRAASLMYRLGLRLCDRVLFQNPDDRALFVEMGLAKSEQSEVTAGSGIDLDYFKPTPSPDGISFLMVARLLGSKGVREYAAAALALKQRWPKADLRLAGWIDQGPDAITQSELDAWIDAGLNYLGRLEDVRPALTDTAVFVLPSFREGTPRSVLEALATGRAVITTDAPGCRETVEHGVNGFLVEPRDVNSLVQAMERFMIDPNLAANMGARSLELVREKYDVRRVNDQVIAALSLTRAAAKGTTR